MTKTTKILLIISLTAFVLGFTEILWGIGKPVGAICFGLFLIFKLLEKESALFDEEQRRNAALAEGFKTSDKNRAVSGGSEGGKSAGFIAARAR